MDSEFNCSRRAALAGLASLPIVSCSPVLSAPPEAPARQALAGTKKSLDSIAQSGGRRFGTAIAHGINNSNGGSVANSRYTDLIKSECGIVVPENAMKWQAIRPAAENYDFAQMDTIVRWAKANDMDVRGHVLLWHRPEWFPDWLNTYDFGTSPASEAGRILSEHIGRVTQRYSDMIVSHDVVNEAIDHSTNRPIETSLSRAMGSPEAVMDLAFHSARENLPNAQLVYNDYMSWEPAHANHMTAVLRLLEGFKKRGTPVDALGIQSHIEIMEVDPVTGVSPYREREWRKFLDEVTGMGYRLLITEFDVKDKALPADTPTRDRLVAEYTRRYFDVMMDYDSMLDDILVWGMVDQFNWLQYFEPSKRADGLEVRGTPYSSEYQAKPMRDVLARVLAS